MKIVAGHLKWSKKCAPSLFVVFLILVFLSNAAGVVLASNCDLDHCSLDGMAEYGNETPLFEDYYSILALPLVGFAPVFYDQIPAFDFIPVIKHPPRTFA